MKRIIIYLLLLHPILNFAQGSGTSITLNGSNQYISIPNSPELNPTSEITLEAWFKPTISYVGVGNEPIILKSFTSHSNPYYQYGLYMVGNNYSSTTHKGTLRFLVTTSTGNYNLGTSPSYYTTGEWYHISGTYDGANMNFYINGELISTTSATGTIQSYNTGVEIGKLRNFNSYTPGEFDELRIWNKAFTQAEIRSNMTKKITSSHPNYANLVAYYNADSGSGSTLVDQSSYTNNGTLYNSPTWQTSSAPLGDENIYLTTVSNGSSLNLVHSDGSDLTVNVTGGTAESLFIYNVNEEPNVTTLPLGLDQLSQTNYWGIKSFGSSSLVYEVVYNYDGHSGISDESNLRLCSRADNATLSWAEESATLNTTTNTLTLGGQTGTEFILGSVGGNTLPVNEFELKDYTFFPNPTSDFLKLTEGDFIDNHYQIFDIRGGKILEGKIKFENKIDVRNLSEGLYFLKFENSESYRFIKNK